MANLQEIPPLGTTPIPGDKPTGDPQYRYSCSEWDILEAEIGLLSDVSGKTPDWKKIQKFAHEVLSKRAKDVAAASYYSLALLKSDGYAGLAAGLEMIKGMFTTFWEGLIPLKPSGREKLLDALAERASELVDKKGDAGESDRAALTAATTAIEGINAVLTEKGCGAMSKLGPSLHSKINSIPAPPDPTVVAAQAAAQQEAAVAAASAEVTTPERAQDALTRVIDFHRKAKPSDPLPFRLIRASVWNDLQTIEHTEGKTQFEGGDPEAIAGWETALKQKDFQTVLDQTEYRFPGDRLWLDLQFYGVRAMEGLGAVWEAARRAVTDEVLVLVRRLPELPTLKFAGGRAFASDATRSWIENEVLAGTKASPAGGGGGIDAAVVEARKLAARRQLPEAMAVLNKGMQGAQGREKFLWRLALARVLVDAGRPQLASPQLESLDKEIQRFQLEDWETPLTVEVVKLLWQCYNAGSPEKASAVYERLCRLDLTAAMALDGKK